MTFIKHTGLDFLNTSYQKDLNILFCRWHTHVDFVQFTEGYHSSLEFAKLHSSNFWLHDLRKRSKSDKYERAWFENEFLPTLKEALQQVTYIAYLMSPLQMGLLLQQNPTEQDEINLNQCVKVKYFTNEHDALLWLQEYQEKV